VMIGAQFQEVRKMKEGELFYHADPSTFEKAVDDIIRSHPALLCRAILQHSTGPVIRILQEPG